MLDENLNRAWAEIDLKKLKANFNFLNKKSKECLEEFHGAICMVKANAYGHGFVSVSKALEEQVDLLAFGVASLEEGIALRENIASRPILLFSSWFNETGFDICQRYGLTPVIHRVEDLNKFCLERTKLSQLQIHLKFNTGLNRLGIDPSETGKVIQLLEKFKLKVDGLCSHFADSDLEKSFLKTKTQIQTFKQIKTKLQKYLNPTSYIHIANSGGILRLQKFGLAQICNVTRPGIGLYGYNSAKELEPVLKLYSRVLKTRILTPGQSVGYGFTFTAKKKVAQSILSIGYGDGLHRCLGNQKLFAAIRNEKPKSVNVLGRVSMDLLSVEAKWKEGDEICLLGEKKEQALQMAKLAHTSVYEILTSLSARVSRVYK